MSYKSMFDPEQIAARAKYLKEEIEKIESTSPRIKRDESLSELNDKEKAHFAKRIKAHEVNLFEMKQEYAACIRFTGAKSLKGESRR